ncbi:hypothetical protein [Leptolyngbya sp. PL-A3]|uniref:hypothetical protein n=1 Tax=Leptolyngbya sp. PL-A3 TaxID=2933911 RepID=UPI003299BDDE
MLAYRMGCDRIARTLHIHRVLRFQMTGFEILLDAIAICILFLLTGLDRNATPRPVPQQ